MGTSKQIIYLEEGAEAWPAANRVLDHFNNKVVIPIKHYKDIFNRPNQDIAAQHKNQAIILAVNREKFLYKGAPVCQDFAYPNFHYTSCVKNCVCDCEYCYLKGMYPCGYLCIFVNLPQYFEAIESVLQKQDLYLCVTYDTDLMPLEHYLGYIGEWIKFAAKQKNLTIEIRTKCKNLDVLKLSATPNVIFAFSLSPDEIICKYEAKTSPLNARIDAINACIAAGNSTRLCFDPIIYEENWQKHYGNMLQECAAGIDFSKIKDVSVGTFRISSDYINNMRRHYPTSKITNYPYEIKGGYCQYPDDIRTRMEQFMTAELDKLISSKQVFLWK